MTALRVLGILLSLILLALGIAACVTGFGTILGISLIFSAANIMGRVGLTFINRDKTPKFAKFTMGLTIVLTIVSLAFSILSVLPAYAVSTLAREAGAGLIILHVISKAAIIGSVFYRKRFKSKAKIPKEKNSPYETVPDNKKKEPVFKERPAEELMVDTSFSAKKVTSARILPTLSFLERKKEAFSADYPVKRTRNALNKGSRFFRSTTSQYNKRSLIVEEPLAPSLFPKVSSQKG
jgi:hypothetical protein